jgi:NTP pyrophosphatase (non-canonical NTP hydrolase)
MAFNYDIIDDELKRAIEKHPIFPKDMFKQLAIMQEEAGEVTKAVLYYNYEGGSIEDVKKELIQTAAMCVRMLHYLSI